MDKKSFIRGFGTGVLFAAVILGISFMIRTSDSAVIQRAKALGMDYAEEEGGALGNTASPEPEGTQTPKDPEVSRKPDRKGKETPEPSPTQKVLSKSEKKADSQGNKEEFDKAKKDMDSEKEKMEKEMENVRKQFSIREGDWSSDVSRRLEELDLVKDAGEFDAYLERNGYSNRIKAGTFTISSGASYEEIAKMITSR